MYQYQYQQMSAKHQHQHMPAEQQHWTSTSSLPALRPFRARFLPISSY
jgi:hypothetical protein